MDPDKRLTTKQVGSWLSSLNFYLESTSGGGCCLAFAHTIVLKWQATELVEPCDYALVGRNSCSEIEGKGLPARTKSLLTATPRAPPGVTARPPQRHSSVLLLTPAGLQVLKHPWDKAGEKPAGKLVCIYSSSSNTHALTRR